LGRGVGDAAFLAQCGAELIVTDLKSKEELSESMDKLKLYENISYVLGEHRLEDFRNRDFVLKAAGVPLDSPYVEEAKKNNIPVRMSADLLVEHSKVKTIGVTGTRGKSTVAHLIAHGLEKAGKHVVLGGNVRGVSNLSLFSKIHPDSILVLELDSWQLQGFGDAKISPNISIFTNLLSDHLNYYPNKNIYFADKANIFKFQKQGDFLITGNQVLNEWILPTNPPVTPVTPRTLPDDMELKIIGEHNRENAALAAEALRAVGLNEEEIKKGLESFEGVEGRLQFVKEVDGVKIYNDNNSTTPEATIAALKALDTGDKNIVLIMGGADKGLDMSELLSEIPKRSKAVVLFAGTGTDTLVGTHYHLSSPERPYDDLRLALEGAMEVASAGDAILFSPGFASFGLFKNEYDRNDQFVAAVRKLK